MMGALYLPTGISPDTFFAAWSRQDRERLIEFLIESLDAADLDADFEQDGCDDEDDGNAE